MTTEQNISMQFKVIIRIIFLQLFSHMLILPRVFIVRANFWATVAFSLAAEDACSRMRINLGVVLIRSLVFYVCVPGTNVPGTIPECFRICGLRRNSSNLDRAPKMRDFVLLNSWDSFQVTLPSISSETCVIFSSLILGTDVFRDWPFLECSSCVPLATAANFHLFLNVAIFLKGKRYAVMKTDLVFNC